MKYTKNLITICLCILITWNFTGCANKNNGKEILFKRNSESVESKDEEIKNGSRFFISEVKTSSNPEKVIIDYFKVLINDNYDEFNNIFIDNETYNYFPQTYKDNYNKGLYTEEITVHSIRKMEDNEYISKENGIKYYEYMEKLKEYNPIEYEIYEVNYTNKLTEEYDKTAQFGSGDWTRYFVVVNSVDYDNWRIFDIYGQL
ncbi:MAG: hypothetical protein E6929_13615 [Clostridium sp.]|nr:hypothetical protein [Clostridium sp.]